MKSDPREVVMFFLRFLLSKLPDAVLSRPISPPFLAVRIVAGTCQSDAVRSYLMDETFPPLDRSIISPHTNVAIADNQMRRKSGANTQDAHFSSLPCIHTFLCKYSTSPDKSPISVPCDSGIVEYLRRRLAENKRQHLLL